MKAGWKTEPLAKCLEKFVVAAKIPKKQFLEVGEFPIVSQEAEFVNGYWNDPDAVCRIDQPVVIFGDHTQVLKYVDFDFVVGADGVKVLSPRDFLDAKFLKYFIQANPTPSLGYARHFRHIKDLDILLPPLEEQKRIVAVLDEAFAALDRARTHAETNLKNARELFEAAFASTFHNSASDWQTRTIGDVCIIKSGGTVAKALEKNSGSIPYLKVADMNLPENVWSVKTSTRFLDRSKIKPSAVLPAGATIFPKRGGAIMTNKKRLLDVDICADLNIMSVRPKEEISTEFLYFYFLGVDMASLGSGSSIPQINNYDIEPLEISYPEGDDEQHKVTKKLKKLSDAVVQLEELYRQKLAHIDNLRQSLLQKAFAGELT